MLLNWLQNKLRQNTRKGFTLTEVIVVLVVIAILAAILIPSFIALIRHGQQTNRDNIARTLYISMQNQLTRATVEGNLRSTLTENFYDKDEYGNDQLISSFTDADLIGRLADSLGTYFPITDTDNINNVYYICKPADYVLGSNEIINNFYAILDEVIVNKEILDGAILMEFNVRTGVVMSIIYGDDLSGQIQFTYIGTGGNSYVVGERGMESSYPNLAKSRQQGYYGVDFTGVAPPLPIEDIVRIFDAMNYDDGTWQLTDPYGEPQHGLNISSDTSNPVREMNVLFAEFLLQSPLDEERSFYVFDVKSKNTELLSFDGSNVYTDFRTAIDQSQHNNHAVYLDTDTRVVINQHGVDVGGIFNRYIWVLDFIEEDIFIQPNNIVEKYSEITMPLNIRAGISVKNGPNIVSPMYANTHFLDQWPDGTFEVTSVRHLNNIRYAQDGDFVQTDHIDMRTLTNQMIDEATRTQYNFKPIESMTGSYNATYESNQQWRIEYLRINTSDKAEINNQNVGFFSTVDGNVIGLSLFDAEVIAPNAGNVGSIVGILDGGQIVRCSSFSNVVGGIGNTGGLIGYISSGGILSYSFNSGFFNTHRDTRTYYYEETANGKESLVFIGTGSVMADGGNIGGLVGRNNGTILRSFSNARVNIEDVELDPDTLQSINPTPTSTPLSGTNIGGIAGLNESTETIEDSYATNFVAIYSDSSINSGGIAGTNTGAIKNSRYISNGTTESDVERRSLLREELSELGSGWLPSGYEINIDFHTAYYNETHKNQYTQYPYPILSNNNPFRNIDDTINDPLIENREMGWEDINAENIIHAGALVYYEFYTDIAPRYASPFLSTTIEPTGSPRYVTHDGYAIEFYPNTQGYILEFGDGNFYRIALYDDEWRVFLIADGEAESMPDENWLPGELFVPTANIPESSDENPVMYRIYIPNHLALEEENYLVRIRLFPGTNSSIDEIKPEDNILGRLNVPATVEEYNPLFANFTNTTNASIRSARHIDNINLVAENTVGVYTQHLNIDFAINYYYELRLSSGGMYVADVTTLRSFSRNAVVTAQFAGKFVGTNMWISNLMINSPSSSNVGLFAESAGIIEQVTLRLYSYTTDAIVGGTNVGGIVGTNLSSGVVRSCFVQHVVTRDSQGQLPTWSSHPTAVRGTSNVGGVVGNNMGVLTDILFTSTSARPAVRGTATASVGGIAGTTSSIDNTMYLAVTPRIGNGRDEMRPFTGSNIPIGVNSVYLSGEPALRPFQTVLDGATTTYTEYNLKTAGQKMPEPAMDSREIIERYSAVQYNSNWTINDTSAINFDALQNHTSFIYPYPIGTVPSTNRDEWPVVASIPKDLPDELGLIYYEKYEPSGIGIFARYIDSAGIERTIDYLRYDNPIITEAGYGAEVPTGFNTNANRQVVYSQYRNGFWSPWAELNAGGPGGQMQLSGLNLPVPQLQPRQFIYLPAGLLLSAAQSAPNPIEPMILFISSSPGQLELPGIKAYVNPFFAKEVYPLRLGTSGPPVLTNVESNHPTEHIVRTPWQLQNISLYIEKSAALCNDEHTFLQEIDIDMTRITGASPRGLGVNIVSPPNTTTPVDQLSTIVRGAFRGIYNGQGNKITNLSLTHNTANNKGLFNTIGTNGVVENLTIYNSVIQQGRNNGGFASVNNGTIRDVAFIYASPNTPITHQPIMGTDATGGIVGTNNGLIENALFLAQGSGSATGIIPIAPITAAGSGTEKSAYYLSGTISSALQPTQAPTMANFNIFSATTKIRGEPKTTQELNVDNGFTTTWKQSFVPTWRNTMLGTTVAENPYPYLGSSPTATWPVATISALDIVYYEEYINGTVGFYSIQSGPELPELDSNLQITGYGYAVLVERAGAFGCSINVNAGNNSYISSTSRPDSTAGVIYNYAKIPTSVISGVSGEIYINDQPTGRWIDTRFAKAIYSSQSNALYPTEIYVRMPQQMIQISNLSTTSGVNITQERDLNFTNISLGNSMAVVTGTFKGTFDGGGNLIYGLTINYTQPATIAQTSYVGLFSQNDGSISRVTLVFKGGTTPVQSIYGNVNSISGSAVFVGSIAGMNTGAIKDVTVISSLLDTTGTIAIAPVGGTGAIAGGIAGENSGEIARVLYLASAPINGTEIYPIVNTQVGTLASCTDSYYLGGVEDAMIIDASLVATVGTGDIIGPILGFDYAMYTQPIVGPMMVDTDGLYSAIIGKSNWTGGSTPIWAAPTTPSTYDFNYQNTYPYIIRAISSKQNAPSAWPIVSVNAPDPTILVLGDEVAEFDALYEADCLDSNEAPHDDSFESEAPKNESDNNDSEKSGGDQNTDESDEAPKNEKESNDSEKSDGDQNMDESDEACVADSIEDSDSSNDLALITGVITLFGGAGFTQTRLFRSYMRKRNARAVRKINKYNKDKRNSRRVDRYILRYYEKNNRRGGVNDGNNK